MDTKKIEDIRDELFHINALGFFLFQHDTSMQEIGLGTHSDLRSNPILSTAELIMEKTAACLDKLEDVEQIILKEGALTREMSQEEANKKL